MKINEDIFDFWQKTIKTEYFKAWLLWHLLKLTALEMTYLVKLLLHSLYHELTL